MFESNRSVSWYSAMIDLAEIILYIFYYFVFFFNVQCAMLQLGIFITRFSPVFTLSLNYLLQSLLMSGLFLK